jgi:hypothetical protein
MDIFSMIIISIPLCICLILIFYISYIFYEKLLQFNNLKLIKKLRKIQSKYGDLKIFIKCDDWEIISYQNVYFHSNYKNFFFDKIQKKESIISFKKFLEEIDRKSVV